MRARTKSTTGTRRANFSPTLTVLKGAIDGLAWPVVLADRQGRVSLINMAARRMLGESDRLDLLLRKLSFQPAIDNWTALLHRALASTDGVLLPCHWPGNDTAESSGGLHIRPLVVSNAGRRPTQPRDLALLTLETKCEAMSPHESSDVSRRMISLGRLAARVAHELNNPLDGVTRFINLGLRIVEAEPDSKLKTYLTESRAGLLRMAQIVSDLLEYSRAAGGEQNELGVNEIIEEALRTVATVAEERRIVVAVDFQHRDMPKFRGSRLYQVVCNLLRNAIDAMPGGGRLTIASGLHDDEVVLRVADTGPGLPQPVERVFEPFFTTKHAGKGTGLGLAICKDYVEQMGGMIRGENPLSGGAVFTVRIPRPMEGEGNWSKTATKRRSDVAT